VREELNLRPLPCQIQRASAGLSIGGVQIGKDHEEAGGERRCQRPAAPTIRHGSPTGRAGPYICRLLPVCCPAPSLTFGTTIRIARLRYPSCLSRRVSDLWFLRTVGDRWCPPMPELDRCDTDPARTGRPVPSGRGRLLVLRSSATRDRSAGRARTANPRPGAPRAWEALSAGEGGTGPSRMVSQSRYGRCQG
jgi:hypothetical protein